MVVPKRQRDVLAIEEKGLSMYARELSQRDIAATIEDIYGFEISHETVFSIFLEKNIDIIILWCYI